MGYKKKEIMERQLPSDNYMFKVNNRNTRTKV